MVVDKHDFDQTQMKSTKFQELVYEAEGFTKEEKEELLNHINDITQQNLGITP
jgi:ClpP class serine protease